MSSETTVAKSEDPDSPVSPAINAALKNIFAALQDAIIQESLMVAEIKAEISGDATFNPFVHYQTQQELMGYTIGVLGKIRHAYELDTLFTGYVIDKMLPDNDAGKESFDLG
jgi:hypothetical protein